MVPMETPSPHILLADDHQLVRDGVALLVQRFWPGSHIQHACDRVQVAQALSGSTPLDLALVDWHMPGIERGPGWRHLLGLRPDVPAVVVSADTSPAVIREALALASVYAFVPKSADAELLHSAMEAALRRQHCAALPPERLPPDASQPQLPPRLMEVQQLLRRGMSNKGIARELNISAGTVRNYLSEIYRQLGVGNRTQAAFFDPEDTTR